ncbi:MAG TPA: hypothetical protein RMH99_03695 [Sandaracinaceae bacterium LLY-WYZ-13_1]|nr:hypothetical protein [Sandaracinaceae bacterium LLY-WYZ-13_1]
MLQLGAAIAVIALVVRGLAWFHGRPAEALYDGELEAQRAMARGMDRWVEAELSRDDFGTGSTRFDGEWLFATRMMAALGYAQTALEHPSLRAAHAPRVAACVEALVSPTGRAFDAEAWGTDPLDDLGSTRDHAAYLGYLALAMALERALDPDTPHAALEQRVVDHLSTRYEASELGLLETYPGEVYPVDNTAAFGALAVHDRVTGQDHAALRARLLATLDRRYRDPRTGLLYQAVDPDDGAPVDRPRGSGTALAAYYLSFADRARSRALYDAIRERLGNRALGFATTREYPPGAWGLGDVDSGPVVLGQGVSATGFTLALARIHGDRETYVATYATASFFGGRVEADGTHHALGGPVGDALLFALATARPEETP